MTGNALTLTANRDHFDKGEIVIPTISATTLCPIGPHWSQYMGG